MTLNLNADITQLKGADYNPRRIDEKAIETLCESIKRLGIVKPLIARGTTLVAGHQRTKALLKIGVKTAPVYFLGTDANLVDEIQFNQLHNGTDMDSGDENAWITGLDLKPGYQVVDSQSVRYNLDCSMAVVRNSICNLITKFGPWGAVVATDEGQIIHAAQYAISAKLTSTPLTVFVIPAARKPEYLQFLTKQYGVFSYEHLPRETFVQSWAQMLRLRNTENGFRVSKTYEQLVIPWLKNNPRARVLDFGCGQGDYVNALSRHGVNIIGIEFYRRKAGASVIDLKAVHAMIDAAIESMRLHGPFDAVVCDSVLNSVDSMKAERDVLNTLDALCKPNGVIFFSGRTRESLDRLYKSSHMAPRRVGNKVEFIDENGFTGRFRKGSWFYQKYHSKAQIAEIISSRGWIKIKERPRDGAWSVQVTRPRPTVPRIELLQSVADEFNILMNSKGECLGRAKDVLKVLNWL